MKNSFIYLGITLSLAFLLGCAKETENEEIRNPSEINRIEMFVKNFKYEVQTKTTLEITEGGANFKWAANDTIGIFPNEGAQAYFPMISGAGTNYASFTGGGWALKPSYQYSAYYPYGFFNRSKEKIGMSYEGQTQSGNASSAHLGDFDYMASVLSTPVSGNVSFSFNHLGALVKIKLTMQGAGSYKQLKLVSDGLFVIDANFNLSTQTINPTKTSNIFLLDLENISTTAENKILELFLMLAPTDLST